MNFQSSHPGTEVFGSPTLRQAGILGLRAGLFRHTAAGGPPALRGIPALRAGLFRHLRPLLLLLFVIRHSSFIIPVSAFPPALPHTLYGMARDEYGNPLANNAVISLTTQGGITVSTKVVPGMSADANYKLIIPMDAGTSVDLYKSIALRSTVPFRIVVKIGTTQWLPIEMAGDYSLLGKPGQSTRIDLTLGEDTNGNGLPDAWERAMIAARGWHVSLAGLNANSSPGTNRVTLMQEYVAGTYGFEDANGLNLNIVRVEAGVPLLEFMSVRGRNYSIVGSTNLKVWTPVAFSGAITDPATGTVTTETMDDFQSTAVKLMQVRVVPAPGTPPPLFYKLRIR